MTEWHDKFKDNFLTDPYCEFCGYAPDNKKKLDKHIKKYHKEESRRRK